MLTRSRVALAAVAVLLAAVLGVPAAQGRAAAVPKVGGLTAAGSNTLTAKLGLRWTRVAGATYQVRWAYATSRLSAAKIYSTTRNSTLSPALRNICITWYAQVRAKKAGRLGRWSTAKALRFTIPRVTVPTPVTSGQTSTSQAQVRWTRAPGAVGYRLHWSPAPFGTWPGVNPYTPFTSSTATGAAVRLPAVGSGDHFLDVSYGNPVFAQLEVKRCKGDPIHSGYVPVFGKPLPSGSADGDPLAFGSYNVELTPQSGDPAIAAFAAGITAHHLDVVALQEANAGTAAALISRLRSSEKQSDWEAVGAGQQQVLYRTSRYTEVDGGTIGQDPDGSAATPLPTPWVRLTPVDPPDPKSQDVFVVSVHLEDRTRYFSTATIPQRKADAHAAALSLLADIAATNQGAVPVLVAGDFKGSFGGFCDESSTPRCQPEGQPTFVRAGYLDARGAVTKVGIKYATVNQHIHPQVAFNSGVGSRADFILAKGLTGFARYENVANLTSTDSPSDHNLIFTNLFVPRAP